MKNLLTAIEQANKLAQSFELQFFAYVSDGEQKENLSSNLVLSDLEAVVGGLREWRTGPIPKPLQPCTLVLECWDSNHLFYAANPYGRKGKWVYDWDDNGTRWSPENRIKEDECTGRWFIQPITLPNK